MPSKYLYLRLLRPAEHTVFCVQNGQKTYYHPQFDAYLPYASGQQVKRSILEAMLDRLNEAFAPVTITQVLKTSGGKRTLGDGEPLSSTDPKYADQLIGGWMHAQKKDKQAKGKRKASDEEGEETGKERVYRRRSPLSISAMRPLHPLLATTSREALTFDRSGVQGDHQVIVRDENGNSLMVKDEQGRLVPGPELQAYLEGESESLKLRTYMPPGKVSPRATGLFVVDVAVDLSRLFRVSLDPYEPELKPDLVKRLKEQGWQEKDGHLVCPKERRDEIIPALAEALVHWRITSNQARTYNHQETIAVALSKNASRVSLAIRAELSELLDGEKLNAKPVIQPIEDVALFVSPAVRAHVAGAPDDGPLATSLAVEALRERLSDYAYDA